jgi:hypothetical protein
MTDSLLSKKCSKCGEWKPRPAFYRSAAQRDGMRSQCKACDAATVRHSRARMSAERANLPSPPEKVCVRCGCEKPAADFNKVSYARDRLSGACRSCISQVRRDNYAANPAVALASRAHNAKYRAETPDYKERDRRASGVYRIKASIAIAVCLELGMDLDKLAKEKYDADLKSDAK